MKTHIRTLKVDLKERKTEVEEKPVEGLSLEEKIGGFGKAVHDIQTHLEANPDLRDGFDSRNLLCLDLGFTSGSKLMTARRTVLSGISPQKRSKAGTNGIYYSTASGDLGPAVRASRLDSIRFMNRSETPVYVLINNGQLSFEDATKLSGKSTDEKARTLCEKYSGAAVAVIGFAGENLVRYAGVAFSTHDQIKNKTKHMRFAGRGGMGALMGSKNLLAIVAMGGNNTQDLGDVLNLNKAIAGITGNATRKYHDLGTFFANVELDELGVGIHDNFSRGSDPRTEQLFKDKVLEQGYKIKNKGCLACGVKCWKEIEKDGKVLGKIDYEPGELLGPNLGINNLEQIMELIRLTDDYGLDSISTGVCLGYEMQRTGKLGDFEHAKSLIHAIAKGEHPLKDGLMIYTNGARNAMQVKGLELAAYPGNTNPGYAFAIAGPHMSIDTYNGAWYVDPKTGERAKNDVAEWIENIVRGPQIMLYDMNGICKFAKVGFDDVGKLFGRVFGQELSADELRTLTKKVNLRARLIDQRLGFTEEDDCLPDACHDDYGSHVLKHFNTREFFAEVKKGVYERYRQMQKEYGLN